MPPIKKSWGAIIFGGLKQDEDHDKLQKESSVENISRYRSMTHNNSKQSSKARDGPSSSRTSLESKPYHHKNKVLSSQSLRIGLHEMTEGTKSRSLNSLEATDTAERTATPKSKGQLKASHRKPENMAAEPEGVALHPEEVVTKLGSPSMSRDPCLHGKKAATKQINDLCFERMELENHELRQSLAATQEELSSCKKDLLRCHPFPQVPDSVIEEDFDSFCHLARDWLNNEMDNFETKHPGFGIETLFRSHEDSPEGIFLQKHPKAGEYLARYFVHHQMALCLFNNDAILRNVSSQVNWTLQMGEDSMPRLDPPRDAISIASWRSETLTALAANSSFEEWFIPRIQGITREIFSHGQKYLPGLFGNDEAMVRFYQKVMLPASQLAKKVHTSSSKYSFSIHDEAMGDWARARAHHVSNVLLVDLATTMTLKVDNYARLSEDCVIGKILLPIEAGLSRLDSKGDVIRLRKRAFLIELNHP